MADSQLFLITSTTGGFAHVYLVSSGNGLTKLVLKRISCPDQASLNELIQEAQVHVRWNNQGYSNISVFIASIIWTRMYCGFL